ncbi:MAG: molybdenum ABC transporter ATP-binding protein [Desulfocapsaceae bacterium]|nr:molybdenum ABC transporter ATP-binding protein [Desulfocapsaceae bacterium]
MELEVRLVKRKGVFDLNASFRLTANKTGLFGPSGSGKSTLMNLLAGLEQADSGYIRLDDHVIFDSSNNINIRPEQRRIGVVFQHAHLFPHLNVRSNVLYGYKRTAQENRRIVPEDLLEALGITELLSRKVASLSGGERQRVALARTMLTCPRLILMDEPLSGLDEELKFQIIPYLTRVFSNFEIPLLFISHSLLEMRLMTREIVVIDKGEIQEQAATETFAKSLWDTGRKGYINLLKLGPSEQHHDLYGYEWGQNRLVLTEANGSAKAIFELDAREILLFRRHPEATSARNLLECRVNKIFRSGNRVRVELLSGGEQLIAQIVPESVEELGIREGCTVVAAVKASAFRKIF